MVSNHDIFFLQEKNNKSKLELEEQIYKYLITI